MNLTWHLAKKDLRRLALPVALWLAVLGLPALWLSLLHVPREAVISSDALSWSNTLGALLITLSTMQMVAGVLLAGFLVLEDPVSGTTAHWLTRPIAGWRLLAAKLIAALLLLVVAPVLALLPAWMVAGFSLRDCVLAAVDWMLVLGGLMIAALTLASLARNLAQHATALLIFTVVLIAGISRLPSQWLSVQAAFNGSPQFLVNVTVLPLLAVALALQYATRKSKCAWAVIALALVVAVSARICWRVERDPQWSATVTGKLDLPLRIGAEARTGVSLLRVKGFTPSERGKAPAIIVEERRRGPVFQVQRSSGGISPFSLRDKSGGAARRLLADPMCEVTQNAITLRVWRLVPEDKGDWPDGASLVLEDSPAVEKQP